MSKTDKAARRRNTRHYKPYAPPGGFLKTPQSILVGGDMTPGLTPDQANLLQLQQADYAVRTSTQRGTEGVYPEGIDTQAVTPVSSLDKAFAPRSLEQAKETAEFLARNGKAFFVVPDICRHGGFVCVPEAKAKPYIDTALVVCSFGTPTPPKAAKASAKNKADKAADKAAGEPDTVPATSAPNRLEGPTMGEANPLAGEPLDFLGSKAALSEYCAMQLRGNGWNEAAVQVVCAAVATGIIADTVHFGEVVYSAKAILYVDRESPPEDVAAFAEAILIQQQGGLYLYLESLQEQAQKITLGEIVDEGLYPKGRRVTQIISGLGKELPPPEEAAKPKRSRKKKAEPEKEEEVNEELSHKEIIGPLACARCRVAACVEGPGNLCDKCESVLTAKAFPDHAAPPADPSTGVAEVSSSEIMQAEVVASFGEEDDPFA